MRRCITGDGLRETLAWVNECVTVHKTEIPSGTVVLDWQIPEEWRVRDAYIGLPTGQRIATWEASPLHLVQYSQPVRQRMTLDELRPHLHTLPEQRDLVPYRTSYYTPTWGFCLAHETLERLEQTLGPEDQLDVVIDAEHLAGSLTMGEIVIPGTSTDEILLSAHACHPALANDNASSIAVVTALALRRAQAPTRRHSLRILLAPGTIGAIAWLDRNRANLSLLRHGLVLANLGDPGPLTYKRSRRGTIGPALPIDRAARLALRDGADQHVERPFTPTGYDERQFGSPGFDLAVGRLTRTPHNEYPEYHTSGDDLNLVRPEALASSLHILESMLAVLDGDASYQNLAPYGEPMLGRRGLYEGLDGSALAPDVQQAALWVLNLSDGSHALLDISEMSGLPFPSVRAAADRLLAAGLLAPAHDHG
jgi:aminopeptidase-like protein